MASVRHAARSVLSSGSTMHDICVENVLMLTNLLRGCVGFLPANPMAWSMTTQTGDIKQLATLVEVSQTLASTLNLEAALHRVLEILEYHHTMVPVW